MKQFLFLLIAILFSSASLANSCYITDKNKKDWSEQHRHKVKITVDEYESELLISAIFPSQIDNAKWQSSFFLKGKDWSKPELLIPIEARLDNNKVFIWYSIHPSLAIDGFVSASYGEECGIEIIYQVEYNKAIKSDS